MPGLWNLAKMALLRDVPFFSSTFPRKMPSVLNTWNEPDVITGPTLVLIAVVVEELDTAEELDDVPPTYTLA